MTVYVCLPNATNVTQCVISPLGSSAEALVSLKGMWAVLLSMFLYY